MLVQQGSVQSFGKAVALWPAHFGGAVLDPFQLQEDLIGMLILPAADSLPLSLRIVMIEALCSSKKGRTSSLSTWTAVTGILFVYRARYTSK